MIETVLIALSLAMDALAVSVSSGISVPGFGWRQGLRMALYFGCFQFAMPLAGWLLGSSVSRYIQAVDHWIAFGLLAAIGIRMIWEAVGAPEQAGPVFLSRGRLAALALATSIDALAVGVGMAFVTDNILPGALVIGGVAFVLSLAGGLAGRRLGGLFQRRAEIAGGLVLAGLGVKILWEHLLAPA